MAVYALSFHANYRCRHSGACCTAGWPIPVEARLLPLLGADVLMPDAAGACVHFDRSSHLCRVQRVYGEAMLPGSCYQFPRRAVIDERGTFVVLSNFCPTAAALLYDSPDPLTIVPQPSAFPEGRTYEGLDARQAWAPLVRPGVMFDFTSYARWEQFLVATFANEASVDDALASIAAAAETLRQWTPATGMFAEWTNAVLERSPAKSDGTLDFYSQFRTRDAFELLRGFVPEPLEPPPPAPISMSSVDGYEGHASAARRYLAAKAFASWAAYEGQGVRTLVAELMISELVLRVECERTPLARGRVLDRALMIDAIRRSDLFLIHLIDRPKMMKWLGRCET
jgi:hypothetical protein